MRRARSQDENAYSCCTIKRPWISWLQQQCYHDVQTNAVKRTLWSELTEDMDPVQDPNASTAGSSETKSVHYINETIDRDIKPSKRPESRRECQLSMCTAREEWIDQLHRLFSLSFAQRVQS